VVAGVPLQDLRYMTGRFFVLFVLIEVCLTQNAVPSRRSLDER
jgi:hypothetical protein